MNCDSLMKLALGGAALALALLPDCSSGPGGKPSDSSIAELDNTPLPDRGGDQGPLRLDLRSLDGEEAGPDGVPDVSLPDSGGPDGVEEVPSPDTVEGIGELPDSPPSFCLGAPQAGAYEPPFSPDIPFGEQGISSGEIERFEAMAAALLTVESIYFVDTLLADEGIYLVRFKGGSLKFARTFGPDGPKVEVVSLDGGPSPFACTSAGALNTYESELAAMTNPMGTTYPELGYEEGDPRVGFVEVDTTCYPMALERIAQLYDAPDVRRTSTTGSPRTAWAAEAATARSMSSRAALRSSSPGRASASGSRRR
ncbi:MAG: hypothetical protein FJ109_06210 [Deltaproteobacteria bacterium]|nr:hypothetical protein [Deltaproteobacteria bacterium]